MTTESRVRSRRLLWIGIWIWIWIGIWIGIGVAALLLVLIVEIVLTGPTRGAVRAYKCASGRRQPSGS
ncbi:MAG: hypothetical protein ABI353_12265 [Isosphaeraceae bacterium]